MFVELFIYTGWTDVEELSTMVAVIVVILCFVGETVKYTHGSGCRRWLEPFVKRMLFIMIIVQYYHIFFAAQHVPKSRSNDIYRYDCLASTKGGKRPLASYCSYGNRFIPECIVTTGDIDPCYQVCGGEDRCIDKLTRQEINRSASDLCPMDGTALCLKPNNHERSMLISTHRDCYYGQRAQCTKDDPCTPCELDRLREWGASEGGGWFTSGYGTARATTSETAPRCRTCHTEDDKDCRFVEGVGPYCWKDSVSREVEPCNQCCTEITNATGHLVTCNMTYGQPEIEEPEIEEPPPFARFVGMAASRSILSFPSDQNVTAETFPRTAFEDSLEQAISDAQIANSLTYGVVVQVSEVCDGSCAASGRRRRRRRRHLLQDSTEIGIIFDAFAEAATCSEDMDQFRETLRQDMETAVSESGNFTAHFVSATGLTMSPCVDCFDVSTAGPEGCETAAPSSSPTQAPLCGPGTYVTGFNSSDPSSASNASNACVLCPEDTYKAIEGDSITLCQSCVHYESTADRTSCECSSEYEFDLDTGACEFVGGSRKLLHSRTARPHSKSRASFNIRE